jgi:subtilisin family serine protease
LRFAIRQAAFATLASVLLVAAAPGDQASVDQDTSALGSDLFVATAGTTGAQGMPGRYIATLADDADPDGVLAAHGLGAAESRRFVSFPGFVVAATPLAAERLRGDDRVVAVEPDRMVRVSEARRTPAWGVDRLDQRSLPLDGMFRSSSRGAGVTVYVIDSGIDEHDQFVGRLRPGYSAVLDGRGTRDCVDGTGHGTHVAGTVGGAIHGVAPEVSLVPVRVLGCNGGGFIADVVAGIDWVTSNGVPGAVATMSLGGIASTAVDNAVRASIEAGVTYVVAAGNAGYGHAGVDACDISPARVAEAVTVAAVDRNDRRPSWSNYGSCVDIFAPGVDIESAAIASSSATATASGTSMAVPHVAGVAALLIDGKIASTPAAVKQQLIGQATTGAVSDRGAGSPNRLLYSAPPTMSGSKCVGQVYAVSGDWDRTGRDGIGWWCDGYTRLRTASGSVREFKYGRLGDVPVVADWNGDGRDTVSVIRDGRWHMNNAVGGGPAERTFTFGRVTRGDVPIAGDWRGRGISLPGIIRDTRWHLRFSQSGGPADISFAYGRLSGGDWPLVGDWNGDGRTTIGIVRGGRWHLRDSLSGGTADRLYTYGRVLDGDWPVAGDWNGDGRSTPAIVRDGSWHLKLRHGGGAADVVIQFSAP